VTYGNATAIVNVVEVAVKEDYVLLTLAAPLKEILIDGAYSD
jgi:hypothetical protein